MTEKKIKESKFLCYSDIVYDKIYGIDTCGYEYLEENNNIVHMDYAPTPYIHLKRLFSQYPFNERDHFVDIGCGKGRVLAVAAKYKCNKITGVDINERMYKIANANMRNMRGVACKNVDVQNINARQLVIEKTMNKFHFFEPFHLKIFVNVLANIFDSIKLYDRRIYIFIYQLHPIWEGYLKSHTSLKKVDIIHCINNRKYYVYSNR